MLMTCLSGLTTNVNLFLNANNMIDRYCLFPIDARYFFVPSWHFFKLCNSQSLKLTFLSSNLTFLISKLTLFTSALTFLTPTLAFSSSSELELRNVNMEVWNISHQSGYVKGVITLPVHIRYGAIWFSIRSTKVANSCIFMVVCYWHLRDFS